MNETIDYGARIRAVCDYLKAVPGEKYKFFIAPQSGRDNNDGCGCILYHGYEAGIVPEGLYAKMPDYWGYDEGINWLVGDDETFESILVGTGAIASGEKAKQAAITALRSYADKNFPLTPKHNGIPDSIKAIFEGRREVALA